VKPFNVVLRLSTRPPSGSLTGDVFRIAGIPRRRHRHRHPREDRREDVGVGVVEFQLIGKRKPHARLRTTASLADVARREAVVVDVYSYPTCKSSYVELPRSKLHNKVRRPSRWE